MMEMTKLVTSFTATAIMFGILLQTGAAPAATIARTWVSAIAGKDSNPCTRSLPCATFQVAHDNTTAGGEIDVLDGGEFGPVVINKAITIANDGAGTAAITPVADGAGVTVQALGIAVVLRGLSLNGVSASGFNDGVHFLVVLC